MLAISELEQTPIPLVCPMQDSKAFTLPTIPRQTECMRLETRSRDPVIQKTGDGSALFKADFQKLALSLPRQVWFCRSLQSNHLWLMKSEVKQTH